MSDSALPHGYSLTEFVSFWLKKLLQVEIYGASRLPQAFGPKPPCGYLLDTEPAPPAPEAEQWPQDSTWDDLRRFMHPCFTQSQGPARLSSGLHQLMPIIVQAALLGRDEIMAIENPEVHLHPSLQLEVAEFLMHQALGGKTILVETHSDLIIRRVWRAVLDEEIKQEALSIQFVSLRKTDAEPADSVMEPLRINDEDRIDNWPVGFLDDDIKESRRLFETMYGTIPKDDQEAE